MLIKVRGNLSTPIRTVRGTKQGSELSPLIFGLFIERLRPLLEHLCPGVGPVIGALRVPEQLYADDLQLAVEDPADMQRLLDALAVFCHLFHMVVNVQKTIGMILRPPHIPMSELLPHCRWQFQGNSIDIADQAKYLGLVFTGTAGAGSTAADTLATAGRRVMAWLLARARQLGITQSALLCRLFDAVVDPVLSYGCQVWGPKVCERLLTPATALDRKHNPGDAAHIDFLRMAAGLPTFSHKWTVLAEYGRRPLVVRWLALATRFWVRVRCMQPGRLVREALECNIALYLQHRGGDSWTACFMRCMVACGALAEQQLHACTTVQQVWGLPIHEHSIRASLATLFDQVWDSGAVDPRMADNTSVVAATYMHWVWGQSPQGPAPHFHTVIGWAAKRMLIRLRVGGFPLRVATGRSECRVATIAPARAARPRQRQRGARSVQRRQGRGRPAVSPVAVQRPVRGLPRHERVCKVCNTVDAVEDVRHFLLECPAYVVLRQRHPRVFDPWPSSPATVFNHPDQAAVASVIYAMLQRRAEVLSPPVAV
jgi:hypothetical protein